MCCGIPMSWYMFSDRIPLIQRRLKGLSDFEASNDEQQTPARIIAGDGVVRK